MRTQAGELAARAHHRGTSCFFTPLSERPPSAGLHLSQGPGSGCFLVPVTTLFSTCHSDTCLSGSCLAHEDPSLVGEGPPVSAPAQPSILAGRAGEQRTPPGRADSRPGLCAGRSAALSATPGVLTPGVPEGWAPTKCIRTPLRSRGAWPGHTPGPAERTLQGQGCPGNQRPRRPAEGAAHTVITGNMAFIVLHLSLGQNDLKEN